MSHAAASAADDDFYDAHPEMVRGDGKRVPLDPHNPAQANLRHEWIEAYAANGGHVREVMPAAQAADVRQAAQQTETLPDDTVAPPPVLSCSSEASAGPDAKMGPNAQTGPDPQIVATAPMPDKPPIPCKLRGAKVHCEHHGRHPGEDGVLSVVPDSYGSIGDTITCVADVIGGCGDHIEWSISGMWTSAERAATTSFLAKSFKPGIFGWLKLWKVDPQTYRASATMCEGGAPGYEIRAYPPDKIEAKIDFKAIREAIESKFALAPISDVEKVKFKTEKKGGAITCGEQWKEDEGSPRVFCECEVAGGYDPLFGRSVRIPLYPLDLIPPGLEEWVRLGFYFMISGAISCKIAWVGKYWPDTAEWQHDKVQGGLEGKLEFVLSLDIFLASEDLLHGEVGGATSFIAAGKISSGEEPGLKMEFKWGGLEAVVTLAAAWGIVEYKRRYPIMQEYIFKELNYPFGGEKKEPAAEGEE